MEIFIDDIPNEGIHLEGELPESIFDLDPNDTIRSVGNVSYSIDLYAFEDVVAFSGKLSGPFELQCGTCLEYFPYEAVFKNWSSELDIEKGQISFDPTEVIREDILMALPSYPRCDEFIEDRVCPKAHLLEREDDPEEKEPKGDGRNVWGVLDNISE